MLTLITISLRGDVSKTVPGGLVYKRLARLSTDKATSAVNFLSVNDVYGFQNLPPKFEIGDVTLLSTNQRRIKIDGWNRLFLLRIMPFDLCFGM